MLCQFVFFYSPSEIRKKTALVYPTRCNVTQFILSGNCSTYFGGTTTARVYKPCFLLSFLLFMTMIVIKIFTLLLLLLLFTVIKHFSISYFPPSLLLPVVHSLDEGTSHFFSKTSALALWTILSPTYCVQSVVLLG
jgi:hypothetical protein